MRQLITKKNSRRIAAALIASASLVVLSPSGARADGSNPVLGEGQTINALSDQDMTNVRGSGYYANLYGYYGLYYGNIAERYGISARLGSTANSSSEHNNYYSAYQNANSSANYYYYAYYYSVRGQ